MQRRQTAANSTGDVRGDRNGDGRRLEAQAKMMEARGKQWAMRFDGGCCLGYEMAQDRHDAGQQRHSDSDTEKGRCGRWLWEGGGQNWKG
ncbi:CIC11C00000002628 [Sungouiella intermedia]|uniref:CIC11C00000002628 n=1 Tax=Sungouiella intermedia TaxID=45354 RepID=A0A1L0DM09_9ASCO|nr:CIC11C00000002628 [[Candida] intermedia]